MFGLEPKADVEAELAFHVEMRIRELIDEGETPERARQRALERFGDLDRARQECVAINERRRRRMDLAEFLTELTQDLGYAFRMMRRTPAFTAAALVTLALGIGANSAIFSVVNGVLLAVAAVPRRRPPAPGADALSDGTRYSSLSAPDFMSVRADARVFEQIEADRHAAADDARRRRAAGDQRRVRQRRTCSTCSACRSPIGRGFAPEENQPGRGNVTILSHGFWQRVFGGDRAVLGRSITSGGITYTIVGVASPESQLPDPADAVSSRSTVDQAFDASTMRGRRSEFLSVLGAGPSGCRPLPRSMTT